MQNINTIFIQYIYNINTNISYEISCKFSVNIYMYNFWSKQKRLEVKLCKGLASLEGKPLGLLQHYSIEGFKGVSSIGPPFRTRHVSLSSSHCKFYQSRLAAIRVITW